MVTVSVPTPKGRTIRGWLPLFALPALALVAAGDAPSWVLMWALAASVFAGAKWLTFADQRLGQIRGRALGYLLAWPGLDARSFLSDKRIERPRAPEWFFAAAKTLLGAALIYAAATFSGNQLLMGWVGMVGIIFLLHFGSFHVLSLCWRRAGVDAPPIMDLPILASSTAEFWGRRWNRAFRDFASRYIFRPLLGRVGIAAATMAVFIVSGLVHDLVISVPADGGYGLPTAYFVLQGLAIVFEHSHVGRWIGPGHGFWGRAFCLAVIVAPLPLLFHVPFVERVVVPMLR